MSNGALAQTIEHNNIMGSRQHQIALVTGSSSGIGFETSLRLARNGIYTYATMRNLSKSKEILGYARKDNLSLDAVTTAFYIYTVYVR